MNSWGFYAICVVCLTVLVIAGMLCFFEWDDRRRRQRTKDAAERTLRAA